MEREYFWLSDRQFARLVPHLPTDTRGKLRLDARRVISGIVHVWKSICRWIDGVSLTLEIRREAALPPTVRLRRDVRCSTFAFDLVANGIAVIALVAVQNVGRYQPIEQFIRSDVVRNLPASHPCPSPKNWVTLISTSFARRSVSSGSCRSLSR
jgi:hypothetical protein